MNPLFNQLNLMNNPLAMFNKFCQNYKGDPKQAVQYMLNSGQISQQQYDDAVKKANAVKQMFGL